jgi:molecular chaperone DnaK (HSP70)
MVVPFGFGTGDVIGITTLAWRLYKRCKGASGEFEELQHEILSLHTALRELQDEAENEESILNRGGSSRSKDLEEILSNVNEVLAQLESQVTKYRSLGTSKKGVWDRMRFGHEGLQDMRSKVIYHTSCLNVFLTSLGTGSLGRIEKKIDDLAAAIRAGFHAPSLSAFSEDDDEADEEEAWTLLMNELMEEFNVEELEAHKEEIKTYIRRLNKRGDLQERAPSPELHLDELAGSSDTTQEQAVGPLGVDQPLVKLDAPDTEQEANEGDKEDKNVDASGGTPKTSDVLQRATSWQQLAQLGLRLTTEFAPRCNLLIANPPSAEKDLAFAHKYLSEAILTEILLKVDDVHTHNYEPLKMKRKELVTEAQAILDRLDIAAAEYRATDSSIAPSNPEDIALAREDFERSESGVTGLDRNNGAGETTDNTAKSPNAGHEWKPTVNTISELFPPFTPKTTPKGHAEFVGIELGDEYCTVAAYNFERQSAALLFNEHGNHFTPTYVAFTVHDILIGDDAKSQAAKNPENTFFDFLVLLGLSFTHPVTKDQVKRQPYSIHNKDGKPAMWVPCRNCYYTPEYLAAFMLRKMVRIAEIELGRVISRVAISSIWAIGFFGKRAIARIAQRADVRLGHHIRGTSISTAVKFAYDLVRESDVKEKVLLSVSAGVYGIEWSLLSVELGVVHAVATFHRSDGISLEGDLVELLLSKFGTKHKSSVPLSARSKTQLARAVANARRQLMSAAAKVKIQIEDFHDGLELSEDILKSEFEQVLEQNYLPAKLESIKRHYRRSKLGLKNIPITDIILSGDVSRHPRFRSRLLDTTQRANMDSGSQISPRIITQINPSEVAAIGSAIDHAAQCVCANHAGDVVAGDVTAVRPHLLTGFLVMEVMPRSVRIDTLQSKNVEASTVIVPQAWQVSVPNLVRLETTDDSQDGIFLRVSYGHGDLGPSEYVLFEVASKLPVHPFQSLRGNLEMDCRVHPDFSIHLGLRMFWGPQKQREFLRVHFSAFGKLNVVLGNTVPITPEIRRHWCVRKLTTPGTQSPASPSQSLLQAAPSHVRNSHLPAPQDSRNRRSSTSALRPPAGGLPSRHRPSY